MSKIYIVISLHEGQIFNVGAFEERGEAYQLYDELSDTASDTDFIDVFPCEVI